MVCNGEFSEQTPVLSGVLQGSVIGPILFFVYINNLLEQVSSTVRLSTDNTIMYLTAVNDSDAASLQQDLDDLAALEVADDVSPEEM